MKRITAIIAAASAIAVAVTCTPTASASVYSPHACGVGSGGWVTASWATSCPFARNIAEQWVEGRCWRFRGCHGNVYSPVTDETYSLVCLAHGYYPEHIHCMALKTRAWIDFTYSGG